MAQPSSGCAPPLKRVKLIYKLYSIGSQKTLYKKEAENLDIGFIISGYSIDDWITDIKNKFDITKTKAEIYNLKTMESKLDELLSEDKKTELEIDDIAALLG